MAKFLSTAGLNEWIPRLIAETERELVIIVPYIKTSPRMYGYLQEANARGVETTIVFRENKLNPAERDKFLQLDNVNLFYHPNVHCKCYYNENYLIISSMNLYEYSELNNREMGVLLHRKDITSNMYASNDPESLFQDAIKEIQEIVRGAHLERKSRETVTEGFEMNIIKTKLEQEAEECRIVNKVFGHKQFVAEERGDQTFCICRNYFDKVNVQLEGRIAIDLCFEEGRREAIFNRFLPYYHEFRIDGFKLYWNHWKGSLYLYPNSRHPIWQKPLPKEEDYAQRKRGIDDLISFMRQFF